MTFLIARYTPPMISASAHVSPAEPPVLPRNKSSADAFTAPSLSPTSGVAEVRALTVSWLKYLISSAPPFDKSIGATKVVIAVVQASITKIRAVIAGFAKFLPRPPKSIFTTSVAKIPPIIGT